MFLLDYNSQMIGALENHASCSKCSL